MSNNNQAAEISKKATTDIRLTPGWILDFAHSVFGYYHKEGTAFDLDPFTLPSNPTNAKRFFTESNALQAFQEDWGTGQRIWVNPPFSRMKDVVKKILEESRTQKHNQIILLTKVDFRTKWANTLLDTKTRSVFISDYVRYCDLSGQEIKSPALYTTMLWCFNIPLEAILSATYCDKRFRVADWS